MMTVSLVSGAVVQFLAYDLVTSASNWCEWILNV